MSFKTLYWRKYVWIEVVGRRGRIRKQLLEDVKRKGTGNCKGKHYLVSKKAMNISYDRLWNEGETNYTKKRLVLST